MTDVLLRALAGNGEVSIKLATVICLLATDGAKLGELEDSEVLGPDGQPKACKRLRRAWLDRLTLAVERGALARMKPERVVMILLQG
ncbi:MULTISPECIES: hypothetical protein [unclassified Bradyrhizobium]|uniref:hypothetical protein n=1 Tax=unclassified Bradyrhizobium TaxID=2631580 RepID=UPI002915EBBE|nr:MULTISPECIES: hypothetical protein [unclassified Bradyrhizobium]